MDNNMDRMQLMKEIGEASFMVNDLTLYLDTHPTDQEALKAFGGIEKAEGADGDLRGPVRASDHGSGMPGYQQPEQKSHKIPGPEALYLSDGPMPWEGGAL